MTQPTTPNATPGKSIYLDGEILEDVNEIAGKEIYVPGDNFTKLPCHPPHNFTNYQEVVEGKDYVKQCQINAHGISYYNCSNEEYEYFIGSRRIIALPLQAEKGCARCGKPIGNPVFTVCDDCWEADKQEGEKEDAAWTRVINDARFYDGTPQMMIQLMDHFKKLGYKLTTTKG